MTDRPGAVVFDVVGTLASLDAVRARLDELGPGAEVFEAWFPRILRDGFALTATGAYAGFAAVAASALRSLRPGTPDAVVDAAVAAFTELTPQPDAVAAVRRARELGARVLTLSNGATASTQGFLERAGLADDVEQVLSIDDVRAWKPSPAPYRLAVERAGLPAGRVALVAVHRWDVQGAAAAGLTTGWSTSLEGTGGSVFTAPDVAGPDLVSVVGQLLA